MLNEQQHNAILRRGSLTPIFDAETVYRSRIFRVKILIDRNIFSQIVLAHIDFHLAIRETIELLRNSCFDGIAIFSELSLVIGIHQIVCNLGSIVIGVFLQLGSIGSTHRAQFRVTLPNRTKDSFCFRHGESLQIRTKVARKTI